MEVQGGFIRLSFGIGLIKKKIRRMRKGWLFNVSGFYAVETVMKDGRVYRIGAPEPVKLEEVIMREIRKAKGP